LPILADPEALHRNSIGNSGEVNFNQPVHWGVAAIPGLACLVRNTYVVCAA